MANTYISFLGTSDYLPCFYTLNGETLTENSIRFIQQVTIQKYCAQWTESDQILILNTQQARQKNWIDKGHNNQSDGLGTCLSRLNLKAKIIPIDIPSGHSEEEIWQIFT